jgi:hypothetical protein
MMSLYSPGPRAIWSGPLSKAWRPLVLNDWGYFGLGLSRTQV